MSSSDPLSECYGLDIENSKYVKTFLPKSSEDKL